MLGSPLDRTLRRTCFPLATSLLACSSTVDPTTFVAVTFNSGTSEGLPHDAAPDDGYGSAEALQSDQYYGDGLAWVPAIDDTRVAFQSLSADIVAFQEIFHPGDCVNIPEEARQGWVCADWQTGDPTVVQMVVGAGYQVACNQGKPDKCLAVKRTFASIQGCDADLCLDGLDGARVPDCGSGSRVGRATLELAAGGLLTVVNVHGSSGLAEGDQSCRKQQFEQVFLDLDGTPAANGERNLILGDFNTDPARFKGGDPSADALANLVITQGFRFLSDVGEDVTPTYGGIVNIDHQISNVLTGHCRSLGVSPGTQAVTDMIYFDHKPLVCDLELPGE